MFEWSKRRVYIPSRIEVYNPPISDKKARMAKIDYASLAEAMSLEYLDRKEVHLDREYHALMCGDEGIFFCEEEDGLISISTNFTLDELYIRLKLSEHQDAQKLINYLDKTKLQLNEVKLHEEALLTDKIRRDNQKLKEINESIQKANLVGSINRHGDFKKKETRGVLQHEVCLTSAESEHPILATFGAYCGIAVAIYNPETKEAMLAHVDSLTNLASLKQSIREVRGDSDETLQVHLAGGGGRSSKKQISQLINIIDREDKMELVSADLGGNRDIRSRSLAIDTRTGEVYSDFENDTVDLGENSELRMQICGMQIERSNLHRVYDGRSGSYVPQLKA